MADGSTLPQSANITSATIATEARRYYLGIVSKLVRYLFEPIDGAGPREELRQLLIVPSTPKTRARGERVKAAVLAAAAKHKIPGTPIALQSELIRAVIAAARREVGRISTARELAAAFGLDVRLLSWRGDESKRSIFEDATISPSGAIYGALNGDAPTLSMSTAVSSDEFVATLAWGCGAMVVHWLGCRQHDRFTVQLEHQIGRALAVRDEDVSRVTLLEAYWPYELVNGEITSASLDEANAAMREACDEIADGLRGLATAQMVHDLVFDYAGSLSWRDSVRAAALHVCKLTAPASACTEIGEAA